MNDLNVKVVIHKSVNQSVNQSIVLSRRNDSRNTSSNHDLPPRPRDQLLGPKHLSRQMTRIQHADHINADRSQIRLHELFGRGRCVREEGTFEKTGVCEHVVDPRPSRVDGMGFGGLEEGDLGIPFGDVGFMEERRAGEQRKKVSRSDNEGRNEAKRANGDEPFSSFVKLLDERFPSLIIDIGDDQRSTSSMQSFSEMLA